MERASTNVEYGTFEWVDWFNRRRLLSVGYVQPAELEEDYWRREASDVA